MSYDLQIRKDRPAAYWPFSGNSVDIINSSSMSVSNISYSYPAIITNSGSSAAALRIGKTSSASIQAPLVNSKIKPIVNKYESPFTISFWFNFNNQLNGSGLGTGNYLNDQLRIFYIKDNVGNVLAKIYYDYLTNSFRFSITGNATEAYNLVQNLEQSFYLVATYSNGVTSLTVNNVTGTPGSASRESELFTIADSKIYFAIDGSSLTGTAGLPSNFLISSLAIFNYSLNQNPIVSNIVNGQRAVYYTNNGIKQHMLWANNDGKPIYQSMNSDSSYFRLYEDASSYGISKRIAGTLFKNEGTLDNLTATVDGLSPTIVRSPYASTDITSSSYSFSSDGLNIVGQGSVDFDNLTSYFDFVRGTTFSAQITRYYGKDDYIFSINNINGDNQNSLYLQYKYDAGNWHYYLATYDSIAASSTIIIDQTLAASATSANIGVSIDAQGITLHTTEGSASAVTFSDTILPIELSKSSVLSIGNIASSPASAMFCSIKNFGIYNQPTTDFSAFDFTSPKTFMFKLNDSNKAFLVSQKGSWTHVVPTAILPPGQCVGTEFYWNSMDNCTVSVSTDGGTTFKTLRSGIPATNYDLSLTPQNLILKIEMGAEYDTSDRHQSLRFLSYNLYRTPELTSDGDFIQITPTKDYNTANYTIGNSESLLNRKKNFGLKFYGDNTLSASTKPPGGANVIVPSGFNYRAIEFWYRPDEIVSGKTNHILNNVSGSADAPAIWIGTDSKLYFAGPQLWINGASYTSGAFTASANEMYHLLMTSTTQYTSNLYLNGGILGGNSISSKGTYGYVTFWPSNLSQNDIISRYQSFFSMPLVQVSDNNNKKLVSALSTEQYNTFKIG